MKQIYKKENRILLSMITGVIVISLLCGIQWRGSQKNVLAWWGSIYPVSYTHLTLPTIA